MTEATPTGSEPAAEEKAPGSEPRGVFVQALSLAKELVDAGTISFALDADGSVTLVTDEQGVADLPEDRLPRDMKKSWFLRVLRTEIDSLVNASLMGDPAPALRLIIPSKVLETSGLDEFRWRLQEVQRLLVPANLAERVKLRRTTKTSILDGVTWQLGLKEHDEVEGPMGRLPFATLCIRYVRSSAGEASFRLSFGEKGISLPLQRTREQVAFELHRADIEELIGTLETIRENLSRLGEHHERET